MKHVPQQYKKGFTLVETMVAISILMLAILGPLSIASSGLRNSLYARDQITAFYLAQEGIEFVRYVRDDNYMRRAQGDSSRTWLQGLEESTADCDGINGCAIDVYEWSNVSSGSIDIDSYVTPCGNASCTSPVMYSTSEGNYTYSASGNTQAPYSRKIKIEPASGSSDTSAQVKVTSTVTWMTPSGTKSFTLTEHLYNLYANL